MHRLPTWAAWSIIPAAAVLTPVLGFLVAIAVAMILGVLKGAGLPTLLALAAAGAAGFLLGRKPPVRWRNSVSAEVELRRASSATVTRSASPSVTAFLAHPPGGRPVHGTH